jgi:hypothetical protein
MLEETLPEPAVTPAEPAPDEVAAVPTDVDLFSVEAETGTPEPAPPATGTEDSSDDGVPTGSESVPDAVTEPEATAEPHHLEPDPSPGLAIPDADPEPDLDPEPEPGPDPAPEPDLETPEEQRSAPVPPAEPEEPRTDQTPRPSADPD